MKAARIRDLMARVARDRRILGIKSGDVRDHYYIVQPGLTARRRDVMRRRIMKNEAEIERLLIEGLK